jgi:hypothetical protein
MSIKEKQEKQVNKLINDELQSFMALDFVKEHTKRLKSGNFSAHAGL